MNRYITALLSSVIIIFLIPSIVGAQATEKKTPRKYDKLLTAIESFAKLNAQIEIREREYEILSPFVNEVIFYTDDLKKVCDLKCYKSANNYYPRLKKMSEALAEAHRRYQTISPIIAERNAALMSEIKRAASFPPEQNKEKLLVALNQLNLENLYHYKAYATTYRSADKAMLSLSASSDLTTIINSFATTTDRLVKAGRAQPPMNTAIGKLKNKVLDTRVRIKTLEDRRKALVCTATLTKEWSVDVRCSP
jgi:hypothetical protein